MYISMGIFIHSRTTYIYRYICALKIYGYEYEYAMDLIHGEPYFKKAPKPIELTLYPFLFWRGEQIERQEIIRMNPGNVRALGFFARQSVERLASSARQLKMDSTSGTNNSGSDLFAVLADGGYWCSARFGGAGNIAIYCDVPSTDLLHRRAYNKRYNSNGHEGISLLLPL